MLCNIYLAKGVDIIYRKTKKIIVLFIFLIAVIFIFMLGRSYRYLKVPNPEELSSIILIDVIGNKCVQKTIIYQELDINNMLDILVNSRKTSKQSTSQFPGKTKFSAVFFKFKSGGTSWKSIYEEEGNSYIHEPFVGIFKLDSNDSHMLDKIIKRGNREDISIPVENIFKINF